MYLKQVRSSVTYTPIILTTARRHDDSSTSFPLCHVTICHYTFDASLSHFVKHILSHAKYEYLFCSFHLYASSPRRTSVAKHSILNQGSYCRLNGLVCPMWTHSNRPQFMTSIPKYPPSSAFLSMLSDIFVLTILFHFSFIVWFVLLMCCSLNKWSGFK